LTSKQRKAVETGKGALRKRVFPQRNKSDNASIGRDLLGLKEVGWFCKRYQVATTASISSGMK
jgi:hypothetical protein